VFQTWIKNFCYHPTKGFIEARDQTHQHHFILDSTTPSPVPNWFDSLISALKNQTSPQDPGLIWCRLTISWLWHILSLHRSWRPMMLLARRLRPNHQLSKPTQNCQGISSIPCLVGYSHFDSTPQLDSQEHSSLPKVSRSLLYYLTTIYFHSITFVLPQNCCTMSICKEWWPPWQTWIHHVNSSTVEWISNLSPIGPLWN
jgi:hypothetical protein